MRHAWKTLGFLIVRWPLLGGTIAVLLAVGFGLIVATPGITWRSAASADPAAFTIERTIAPDDTAAAPVADFALTDQAGHRVRLREQAGKVVVVNFVTTRCTTICVQVTRELRGLQQALGARMGHDVVFLSVGLDPRWDTPVALRTFARRHEVDFGGWAFLSGSAEELEATRQAFGAVLVRVPRGQGHHADDLEHTAATYLVDRQGVLRKKIPPGWLTLTGLREIEAVLGPSL